MTDPASAGRDPVRLFSPAETRRRIEVALSGGGHPERETFLPPPAATDGARWLTLVPPWAAEAGVLYADQAAPRGGPAAWLWLAPSSSAPTSASPGQLVLALPGGRYAVSTWDTGRKRVTGSESAAGGPLVCGPPFAGAPLVVAVRRVADAACVRGEEREEEPE